MRRFAREGRARVSFERAHVTRPEGPRPSVISDSHRRTYTLLGYPASVASELDASGALASAADTPRCRVT